VTTKEGTNQMNRTAFATQVAPLAAVTRPCSGFGHGSQWRDMAMCGLDSTNDITTKRPARHLGKPTT